MKERFDSDTGTNQTIKFNRPMSEEVQLSRLVICEWPRQNSISWAFLEFFACGPAPSVCMSPKKKQDLGLRDKPG